MSKSLRLGLVGGVAVLLLGASSVHLLWPDLRLPPSVGGGSRAQQPPTPVTEADSGDAMGSLTMNGRTFTSIQLRPGEWELLAHLESTGIEPTRIDLAGEDGLYEGAAKFHSLETNVGALVVVIPLDRPLDPSVCEVGGGPPYDYRVRVAGTTRTTHGHHQRYHGAIDGLLVETQSPEVWRRLLPAGVEAVACAARQPAGASSRGDASSARGALTSSGPL